MITDIHAGGRSKLDWLRLMLPQTNLNLNLISSRLNPNIAHTA